MIASSDVLVCGHLTLDMIPDLERVAPDDINKPGRLFEVGPLAISTGGVVSNTGLALHRLGVAVRLMAVVGDDMIGRMILSHLQQHDPMLTQHIEIHTDVASGYTIALSPENSDRTFLTYPGSNATFGLASLDFEQVACTKVFHLGYPPILPRLIAKGGEELQAIYSEAKASGAVTSLDMSLPDPGGPAGQVDWENILSRVLPYVDLFVPSIEEILYMLRKADFDAWKGEIAPHLEAGYLRTLADQLLAMGAAIVGFKLGPQGIYLQAASHIPAARLARLPIDIDQWNNTRVWSPAYSVTVRGTTGAGDAAYAGLLAAMLRGMSPQDASRWACAVGACNVEAPDAISGVQTWAEIEARLGAGWPTQDAMPLDF